MSEVIQNSRWPWARRHALSLRFGALLLLTIAGSMLTMTLTPHHTEPLVWELVVSLLGAFCGLWAARRLTVAMIAKASVGIAALVTALLWSDLGVLKMGARRHLELGAWMLQPSVFWVFACHCTAASVATEGSKHWPWLLVALAGAAFSSLAMPELSIVPQVFAGLLAIAWTTGRRRIAVTAVVFTVLAIAASALLPYVRRRWIGFLDPDAHARGAGYDYRALGKLIHQSVWWGAPETTMPRTSSPADDYWFAAATWRFGRLPVVLWTVGLLGTLRTIYTAPPVTHDARSLLVKASVAAIVTTLAIHIGYNVGLWPITAISAPFSGVVGGATGMMVFALSFGTMKHPFSEGPDASKAG